MITTQPAPATTPIGRPPLLITRSTELAATIDALTGPGQPLLVTTPQDLPGAGWRRSPLILIDAATAPDTFAQVGASMDTRHPILLCPHPEPTPDIWRAATALRAEHLACLPEATGWLRDQLHAATRDTTLMVTVLDACGGPHATTLAAALAAESCAAGRDTLLAATGRHHHRLPALLDTLPTTHPDTPGGEVMLLCGDPDTPYTPVGVGEIHHVLNHALPGDTVIIDAPDPDTAATQAAAALADLTLLVLGPGTRPRDAVPAAARTLALLAPHAYRLGLVLPGQRLHRPLTTALAAAAAHAGWTGPLPLHTCHPSPGTGPVDATALLGLARSLLHPHLTPPSSR